MKKIELTRGQTTLVDGKNFEKLNEFKWYAHKCLNTFYAVRNSLYINGKRTIILMHHEIIGRPPKGMISDHRDGNGLNNQGHNLRHVTCRQNQQNQVHRNKSSQYPGVYWHKSRNKWVAQIKINNKNEYLGLYISEFDAFQAYKQAVESLGETVLRMD